MKNSRAPKNSRGDFAADVSQFRGYFRRGYFSVAISRRGYFSVAIVYRYRGYFYFHVAIFRGYFLTALSLLGGRGRLLGPSSKMRDLICTGAPTHGTGN